MLSFRDALLVGGAAVELPPVQRRGAVAEQGVLCGGGGEGGRLLLMKLHRVVPVGAPASQAADAPQAPHAPRAAPGRRVRARVPSSTPGTRG